MHVRVCSGRTVVREEEGGHLHGPTWKYSGFSKVFILYRLVLCDLNPKVCVMEYESNKTV